MPTALKWILTGLGVVAVAVCGSAIVLRSIALPNQTVLFFVVLSPYIMAGTVLAALILSVICRQLWLAVLTSVVAAIALVGQLAFYYFGTSPEERASVNLRVLSANLRYGEAEPQFLLNLARNRADLLAVQELTPETVRALSDSRIGVEFPYSVLYPGPGATGIGLWSRYPIERVPLNRVKEVGLIVARVRVPGVRNDPLFASVHVAAPVPDRIDEWRNGLREMAVAFDELDDTGPGGAVIAAGDYNSTPDMRNFRDLLTNGYQDAVNETGSGWAPTYPSDKPYPPVITIDHALVRGASARSVDTIDVPGSDHRAILVNIQIPVDPTAS